MGVPRAPQCLPCICIVPSSMNMLPTSWLEPDASSSHLTSPLPSQVASASPGRIHLPCFLGIFSPTSSALLPLELRPEWHHLLRRSLHLFCLLFLSSEVSSSCWDLGPWVHADLLAVKDLLHLKFLRVLSGRIGLSPMRREHWA